jgi:hypothetical protein
VSVHEYLLAGWGMPIGAYSSPSYPTLLFNISIHQYLMSNWTVNITIFVFKGELFDLEALSKACLELNRYSFFVTSMPLNMPGGVSSPPNAMAIF